MLMLLFLLLVGHQNVTPTAKDLLSEAWSGYWTVTSRQSVETGVMYVIMTLLLTTCPAVCVYYSMRCTWLINCLYQYTHLLDSQTKVNFAPCCFRLDIQYSLTYRLSFMSTGNLADRCTAVIKFGFAVIHVCFLFFLSPVILSHCLHVSLLTID